MSHRVQAKADEWPATSVDIRMLQPAAALLRPGGQCSMIALLPSLGLNVPVLHTVQAYASQSSAHSNTAR